MSERWTLHHADCIDVLRAMPDKSVEHAITDPPYSERQHAGVRSSRRAGLTDGNGRMSPGTARRVVDLGFGHFDKSSCRVVATLLARVSTRWVMVFCDDDLLPVWRSALRQSGLDQVRVMQWIRIGGAPQFTGDRPAAGCEYIVLAHHRGRKRWNGGGKAGVYEFPIVANRNGHRSDRVHTTQKPVALMQALVEDFTDPGETILDPFAGSGTTGVAALRLGRRFIGVEKDATYAQLARDRLSAEEQGSTLTAARAGQLAMFAKKVGGT